MRRFFSLLSLGLAAAVVTPAIAQPPAPAQAEQGIEQGYEALTRGPVHEAFAEPVSLNSKATAVVPKRPPELIEEVPPDSKPAGAEWISGYWSWDDERNDFIWVSGVWRVPPAGQRWVAGYWTESEDGYRRVSGFWTSAQADSVEYLPEPPETQEAGPTSAAPGENYFWIPGCWQYRDYRYAWRPGYWSQVYDNWVWTPQHYIWTPRGAVFINGYWDYPLVRRGLLFAPVYFNRPIYRDRGFYYSPGIVINAGGLQFSLFARPNYRSYYFGDFYGDRYARSGYYPWYAARQWGGYDPLYHYHWAHDGHHSRDWEDRIRDRYRYYNDHQDARPARTFAELQRQNRDRDGRNDGRNDARDNVRLAVSLNDAVRSRDFAAAKLTTIQESQRREIARESREASRAIADRRMEIEKGARVAARPVEGNARARVETPSLKLPGIKRGEVRTSAGAAAGDDRVDDGRNGATDRNNADRNNADRNDRRDPRDRNGDGRPDRGPAVNPNADRPAIERPNVERPNVDRPNVDRPKVDRPKVERPNVDRPAERPNVDRPNAERPNVERPRVDRPNLERPNVDRPNAERPAPRVERPTPQAERPAPRVERPAPRVERPAPQAERPAPRAERPAPRAERPAPRAEQSRGGGDRGGDRGGDKGGRGRGKD